MASQSFLRSPTIFQEILRQDSFLLRGQHAPRPLITLGRTLAIALVYSLGTWWSLRFATLEGDISSVWIPSAFTFAFVYWWGRGALGGIVLGSVLGLFPSTWALLDLPAVEGGITAETVYSAFHWRFLLLQGACVLGNVLQPYGAVKILQWQGVGMPKQLLRNMRSLQVFLVAAIASPMVSALVGVTAASVAGTVPWSNYGFAWITWWLASALAHLIFTPALLFLHLWFFRPDLKGAIAPRNNGRFLFFIELWALGVATSLGNLFVFQRGHRLEYLFLIILLLVVFCLGRLASSLWLVAIAFNMITSTFHRQALGLVSHAHNDYIFLQSFLGVLSLTVLITGMILEENKTAKESLERTLENLEDLVAKRSQQLYQSEAQLDGFFREAPVGMGIVDRDCRYVRVNDVWFEITTPPEGNSAAAIHHIGQPVDFGIEALTAQFHHRISQVFHHGTPIADQELAHGKITWLVSYFPIGSPEGPPEKVGCVLFDVSDRRILEKQLEQQARLDGLTQIANRRYFNEILHHEWYHGQRSQQPLSLIICDADHFKDYNDYYGHVMGDQCLQAIARILQEHAGRSLDLAARYGGEEFVLLLPATDLEGALAVAKKLQTSIHTANIPHQRSPVAPHVTLSVGVASILPALSPDPEALLQQADEALYKAKHQGRNQIHYFRSQSVIRHDITPRHLPRKSQK